MRSEGFVISMYCARLFQFVNFLRSDCAQCVNKVSECGVTANIPVLGTGDSGFESLHSDSEEGFRKGNLGLL